MERYLHSQVYLHDINKNISTFTIYCLLPQSTVNSRYLLLDLLFERLRKFHIILQEPVRNAKPKRIALQREVYCAQYYGRNRKLLETEGKDRNCLGLLHEGMRMAVVVVV